jgi:hypothetical protein
MAALCARSASRTWAQASWRASCLLAAVLVAEMLLPPGSVCAGASRMTVKVKVVGRSEMLVVLEARGLAGLLGLLGLAGPLGTVSGAARAVGVSAGEAVAGEAVAGHSGWSLLRGAGSAADAPAAPPSPVGPSRKCSLAPTCEQGERKRDQYSSAVANS